MIGAQLKENYPAVSGKKPNCRVVLEARQFSLCYIRRTRRLESSSSLQIIHLKFFVIKLIVKLR